MNIEYTIKQTKNGSELIFKNDDFIMRQTDFYNIKCIEFYDKSTNELINPYSAKANIYWTTYWNYSLDSEPIEI